MQDLSPYRRHLSSCPHAAKGQRFTLCACPIWVDGKIDGKRYRRSLGTTDWDTAIRKIQAIHIAGPGEDRQGGMTVAAAVKAYLADCNARSVRASTIASYRRTLRHLPDMRVSQISTEAVSAWRAERKVAPGTQRKELEHVRFFFQWCVTRRMIAENPARAVKPPRVEIAPTLPYTQDEVEALLGACDRIASDDPDRTPYVRARARAFILLLLHSGLRRSDAALLRRDALQQDGYLTLRIEKTRVPLKVHLPHSIASELRRLPSENPEYFFWSGKSKPATVIGNLWRTVQRIGQIADIHATPHRFRDTFACRLLENGQDIRVVQKLLGHKSLRTTELHYSPWVQSHQKLLDSATATLDFLAPSKPPVRLLNKRRRNA